MESARDSLALDGSRFHNLLSLKLSCDSVVDNFVEQVVKGEDWLRDKLSLDEDSLLTTQLVHLIPCKRLNLWVLRVKVPAERLVYQFRVIDTLQRHYTMLPLQLAQFGHIDLS